MKRLLAVMACLLAGCASAPPLRPPDRVESFCSAETPAGSAVTSILSSVSDRIETSVAYPGAAILRTDVKQNGGVIGHWKSQPLYMPAAARALALAGNYIDVTDVVIDNQLSGNESRLIYVTLATPRGPEHVILRAYDTRNACGAGPPLN
ncbi:MAG TPA: hypothetical protein VIK27_09120 [Candidatus Aquilonibacter sp.]